MFPRKNRVSRWAGVTQLVECNLAKVDVAGSNPVSRSISPLFPIQRTLGANRQQFPDDRIGVERRYARRLAPGRRPERCAHVPHVMAVAPDGELDAAFG